MTFLSLFFLVCCNNSDLNPKSGQYGLICYPPTKIPDIYEIRNEKTADQLKGCKEISGIPIINNSNFKDLSFLKGAVAIEGLEVKVNEKLKSLHGLENLQVVDKNFFITSNKVLNDYSALKNLKRVGGSVYIYQNSKKFSEEDHNKFQNNIAQTFSNVKLGKLIYIYYIKEDKHILHCVPSKVHGFSCNKKIHRADRHIKEIAK